MKYFAPYDHVDCGPTCLRMIAYHYGRHYSSRFLQKISYITKQGVSLASLSRAAEEIGFKALVGELSLKFLKEKALLPCILYWDEGHFVVLYKITQKHFFIADPGKGKVKLDEETFTTYWLCGRARGFGLFLEPTSKFHKYDATAKDQSDNNNSKVFDFIGRYLKNYKRNFLQVLLSIATAGLISLFFPFLTQSIIDYGIEEKNTSFIILILIAQLSIFIAGTITELVRSHLLLHIGARINISILSDFLIKLMRLPIGFFDSKTSGDLMERIADHRRIDDFITSSLLIVLFAIVNLMVYSYVMAVYSYKILIIFLFGSSFSVAWTLLFLRWRRNIDYKRFRERADSHEKLYEMLNAVPEIKLNSYEQHIRWELESLKIRLFKVDLSNLKIEQYQEIGSSFFNQLKNIIIIFTAAQAVIQSEITIGMMMAVMYIIGQLNIPINQFIELVNSFQRTKIGVERINEVYTESEEENNSMIIPTLKTKKTDENIRGIELRSVSFRYGGQDSKLVLKNINLKIPEGKITAIVGSSGSGKTTLLKLLLKFYNPTSGNIYINNYALDHISPQWWRNQCGTVMQEGYIFSDTIKQNIIMGQDEDIDRIINAVEIANIGDFIAELPLHFETKIGTSGIGISTGQKQRILIARAVYKNPNYLFFDEATSSLDAKNEKEIMDNLNIFFVNKTVIIIAHRLSTVKNADQIVVLEDGEIIEVGKHATLIERKGRYFSLVKNQLELGV